MYDDGFLGRACKDMERGCVREEWRGNRFRVYQRIQFTYETPAQSPFAAISFVNVISVY